MRIRGLPKSGKYIEVERNGVRIKIAPRSIRNYIKYMVYRNLKRGTVEIEFVDRYSLVDAHGPYVNVFMELCGFEFNERGQLWEIQLTPTIWREVNFGLFDELLQKFYRKRLRGPKYLWDHGFEFVELPGIELNSDECLLNAKMHDEAI